MSQQELDPELEAIRAKRMAELQGVGGGGAGASEKEAQKQQMEEARKSILGQILTPEAKERLSRVALVKPETARAVEDMLIRAAQTGQLGSRVDEPKIKQLLEQTAEQKPKTKITIQRRKAFDDDDDF